MNEYDSYWLAEQERQYQEQIQQNHLILEVPIPEGRTEELEVSTNEFCVLGPEDNVDYLVAHPTGCAIITASCPGEGAAFIHLGALAHKDVARDLLTTVNYRFKQKTGKSLSEGNPKVWYASDTLVTQLEEFEKEGVISNYSVDTAETSEIVMSNATGEVSFR